MTELSLGVCWYPEQWPPSMWAADVARMQALGLQYVRLGEFAWSRIEPRAGEFHWEWLDEVLGLLADAKLRAVLGTPTATPPKWLVDASPDILPVDSEGRTRRFGSRRHTCFASSTWRAETERVVTALAQRYGRHAAVAGWQTDNEYGCHGTVRCYCAACHAAFRGWLRVRYSSIEALNEAWGTAFWSQEYGTFDEVDLPLLTVTEAHPALRLDFHRFASSQVCTYNQLQCGILRAHSPGRFVTHNFMGFFDDLDAFALSRDLDFAAWDSYPLGFSERFGAPPSMAHTGHPDVAAFHHDLYRGASVAGRPFWVMEQQPGPVNWGVFNPDPAPGMVRLWTWEAFAHGAATVSYFRWRQAAHAQEQMHAGLLAPDDRPAPGYAEAQRVAREMAFVDRSSGGSPSTSAVALVFDYEASWIFGIQPHGQGLTYFSLVMTFYEALRRLGLDVDVLGPDDARLKDARLIVAPSLPIWRPMPDRPTVVGPRTASRTESMAVNTRGIPALAVRAESLPPAASPIVLWDGRRYTVGGWREWVEADTPPLARFEDGVGAIFVMGRLHWLAFWPTVDFLMDYLEPLCGTLGVATVRLPPEVRLRRRGTLTFAFNHGAQARTVPAPPHAHFLLGGRDVEGHAVTAWCTP